MENKSEKLLTPKQVAELFGVAITTIHRMAYQGQLPHVVLRRGKRKAIIRFKQDSLEKFLKKHEIVRHHSVD